MPKRGTEGMAVVEVMAGAAGMTEAAAYTTAGAAVAAGVAETTSMTTMAVARPGVTRTEPDRPEDWSQMTRQQRKNWKSRCGKKQAHDTQISKI